MIKAFFLFHLNFFIIYDFYSVFEYIWSQVFSLLLKICQLSTSSSPSSAFYNYVILLSNLSLVYTMHLFYLVQYHSFFLSWLMIILKPSKLLDQLTCRKKFLVIFLKSIWDRFILIALAQSLSKSFFINFINNELAGVVLKAFTKNNNFFIFTFKDFSHIFFLRSIFALFQVSNINLFFTVLSTNNKPFKKFIKIYLTA